MKNIVRTSSTEGVKNLSVFGMAVRQFLVDEQAKGRDIAPHLEKMHRLGFKVKDIIG